MIRTFIEKATSKRNDGTVGESTSSVLVVTGE